MFDTPATASPDSSRLDTGPASDIQASAPLAGTYRFDVSLMFRDGTSCRDAARRLKAADIDGLSVSITRSDFITVSLKRSARNGDQAVCHALSDIRTRLPRALCRAVRFH